MKNFADTLFKVNVPQGAPACGALLVAEPFLGESFFNHGVVALIDYVPQEGATGVVMNNRTDFNLDEVYDKAPSDRKIPVYCGGPLGQDRLYFIHTLGDAVIGGAREFAPGIYIGGDFDAILNYVGSGYAVDGCVRFFVGYCSWESGQLERELDDGAWALASAPSDAGDLLFHSGDKYWHRVVRSLGDGYRSWLMLPRNPEFN